MSLNLLDPRISALAPPKKHLVDGMVLCTRALAGAKRNKNPQEKQNKPSNPQTHTLQILTACASAV